MWYWLSKTEKSTGGKEVAIPGLENASSLGAPGRDSSSQKQDVASRMEGVSALPDQDGPARQKDGAQWTKCALEPSGGKTQTCVTCLLQPLKLSTASSVKQGQKYYLPRKAIKTSLKSLVR